MNEQKISREDIIDKLKLLLDSLPKTKNPILARHKIEFQLFYEDDLKVRELAKDETQMVDEVAKKCSDLNINFSKHIEKSRRYIEDSLFWIVLFQIERLKPGEASATILDMYANLKLEKKAFETSFDINSNKSLLQFTEAEVLALNFNFARPIRLDVIERKLNILEPFIEDYKHISPDEAYIKILRTSKLEQANENNSTNKKEKLDNNTLQFHQYLKIETPELFAKKLKNEFKTEKGKDFYFLIKSLQNRNILLLGNGSYSKLYSTMKEYFSRDIGSETILNRYKSRFDDAKYNYTSDFEMIDKRVQIIISMLKNK